ncbi:ribosomal 40S subunit protein S14B [Maublancomyces gigas]|uniref:Ribosomal 40S subunit protein S14B n=1 Tax=Discina gigas TaxID=1032678 RepID=A0ABR3GJ80_9PEZI
MASQEDSRQPIILDTPTSLSSPLQQPQGTTSSAHHHHHHHNHHHRDRPSIRLIPPPPFTSTTANSLAASSSSTLASTMPTIDPTSTTSTTSLSTLPPSPSTDGWEDLSSSLIDSYDLTTLRSKLQLANQLIKSLSSSLSAIRTNAAHYLLQHRILEMETAEAAARHQVESEITRREVEVLRLDQSAFSTTQQLALAEENEAYKRRLRKAKRSIREYREELGDAKDENERLKKRIRDNRQHQLDASRSPDGGHRGGGGGGGSGGGGGGGGGGHVSSTTAERHTARRAGNSEVDTNQDDGLVALGFLASQVLSQEMDDSHDSDSHRATTPKPKHRKAIASAPPVGRRALMSPVAFTTSTTSRSLKRRRSRDSTISASADEGLASESAKRRRLGHGANTLHNAIRKRRCTHSPHPTPTTPLIHEQRSNRRHHIQDAKTPPQPGTPVSPPRRVEEGGRV